ncbi:MAG: hypothetical protein LBV18_02130 [Alistipes sp.]|nr:hypothetical protein [Alistipes sp.]
MKNILRFAAVLAAAFFGGSTVSCLSDVDLIGTPGGKDKPTRLDVTVEVPSPSHHPSTRLVGEQYDNTIERLTVVVERVRDGEFVVSEAIPVAEFEQAEGGGAVSFSIMTSSSTTPVRFMVLANLGTYTEGLLSTAVKQQKTTDEQLRSVYLTDSFYLYGSYGESLAMPMSGEATLSSLPASAGNALSIPLMRSVARAEVMIDLDEDSKDFVPTAVQFAHASSIMQVVPDIDVLTDDDKGGVAVNAPSMPLAGFGAPNPLLPFDFYPENVAAGTPFALSYIPEDAVATTALDDKMAATCLVVGGHYDGDTSKTVWYRLDFDSGAAGHPFGQVLRNYRYVFTVKKVTGPGRDSADEAANSTGTAIVAELVPWNLAQKDLVLGGDNFLSISDMILDMTSRAGSSATSTVISSGPFSWQLSGAAATTNQAFQENAYFAVSASSKGAAGEFYATTFTVTAKGDNTDPDNPIDGVISILPGNGGNAAITWHQNSPVMRTDKVVTVYSAGSGVGTLGNQTLGSANAAISRSLLDAPANFGAGGTVKVAGFNFADDPTGDLFTNAARVEELAATLENVDILVLGFGIDSAAANSQKIIEWMQDPAHVTFVASEKIAGSLLGINLGSLVLAPTNEIFRSQLSPGYTMTWTTPDIVSNLTVNYGGILPNPLPAGSTPFFAGPFGTVSGNTALNADFDLNDILLGYVDFSSTAVPAGITPIVYTAEGAMLAGLPLGSRSRESRMMMGVDTANRIVWVGDSDLLNTDGSAGFDTMIKNLWAWAAKTAATE